MLKRAAGFGLALFLIAAMTAPVSADGFASGYYHATGTVRPLGASIYMEGTHYLESASGGMICLLESGYYNLATHEGDKVTVSGWTDTTVEGSALIMDVSGLTVIAPGKTALLFTILEKSSVGTGWATGDATKRKFVIRDADAWRLFYRAHKPGATAPKVDFAKYQVVAAFMGPQPTGGYSITIGKVEKSGTKLYVTTKTTTPAPGAIVTMALTNPWVLATTLRTTGKAYFDGKLVRVLTVADFQTDPNSLLVLGHVTAAGGVDLGKVKVGVFSMDDRARYFVWPGMFPVKVAGVDALNGSFLEELVPDGVTGNPYLHYTVIVWEDANGDGSTSGEAMITSESFTYSGAGTWKGDLGGNYKGLVQVELTVAK